jgi:uroporphyrinogen decarboxylase
VVGVDWRCDLAEAWRLAGYDRAVQGNLDPVSLFADLPTLRKRALSVLQAAERRPGHIFNLGHGVLPGTPVDSVKALVELVHEAGSV